jgi:serine O-acetyltransferase
MIKTKEDLKYFLETDRIALGKPKPSSIKFKDKIKLFFFPDYIYCFQKTLRKTEYLKNKNKNIFDRIKYFFVLRKYYKLSYKLGFTIPVNVFGPGLSIAHHGTIIINAGAKIGCNCRIHAGVNIGTEAGYSDKAPTLGDNIYIAPGAKIFGGISIPNNTAIAANAVVNKSFTEENTAIGGMPANIISTSVDIDNMIIRATEIIRCGLNTQELSGIPAREIKKLLNENRSAN